VKYANILLALCISIAATAQTTYWQQQVNFKMDVTLNDAEHTLDGFAKIEYINNSPDTIRYIWFHLWPNAYRTDRTAFSDQLLKNGRTDFYFSNKEDRGYINRLDFRVNEVRVSTEDHPQHIDIIKVILNQPLAPCATVIITTPFHVQLPKNFSRGGHVGQSYQITQWYPKPAVYDKNGWHEMPYLDQGEFYNNFGNYEVKVTVPKNYVVLSSGDLQSEEEKQWLMSRKNYTVPVVKAAAPKPGSIPSKVKPNPVPSSKELKTLIYTQTNISDFAWFADKTYKVNYDTLQLSSGKIINVYTAHFTPSKNWSMMSITMVKDAVRFRSSFIGDYPYSTVSVVEAKMGFEGGMEYPCITSISPMNSEEALESVIEHEVGHNWFQAMIGSNERKYAWMDEGINSYYDKRFDKEASRYKEYWKHEEKDVATDKTFLSSLYQWRKDQPLNTTSDSLTELNYGLIAYTKGAAFMQLLENKLGKAVLDKAMQQYFEQWKYKHPSPDDLKAMLEQSSGVNLDHEFSLLDKKGPLVKPSKIKVQFKPLIGAGNDSTRTIIATPFLGYNMYDGVMIGAGITNYTLPTSKFQFLLAPMYATKSKEFNGIGRMSYTFHPAKTFERITVAMSGMKFTTNDFTDTAGTIYRTGFRKFVPSLKFVLKEKDPLSTRERFVQWKTFLLTEDKTIRTRDSFPNGDLFTVITIKPENRYVNQLRFVMRDSRALYPYSAEFMAEQTDKIFRLAFTGNYFFNYAKQEGGVNVRVFAGKLFYENIRQRNLSLYELQMSAPKGDLDYTYSNYFIGRNEYPFRQTYEWNIPYQQIMIRDGGFKVNTDAQGNIGSSRNWLFSMSGDFDIPDEINILKIFPVKIPLKIYAEMGTYAEAWERDSDAKRILFSAGLHLPIFKETIHVYLPLFYSLPYQEYYKSSFYSEGKSKLLKTISFSIDIQNISLKKLDRRLPF
jgi:hypothetical protein